MRIAVPVVNGKVSAHFGHCEVFALYESDPDAGTVKSVAELEAPEHVPGLLPRWLVSQGTDVLLCGGIGGRARAMLEAGGVEVVSGVEAMAPEEAAVLYVRGELEAGGETCGGHGVHAGNCGR